MQKKFIITPIFLFCFLFISSGFASGLDLEYKDYEIKKGDTLWDISQAELNDYFLWPNIWKENPEIKNPDLIFPAQHIRIPIYLLQKQVRLTPPEGEQAVTQAPAAETPVSKETVEEKEREMPKEEVMEEEAAVKEYLFGKNMVIASGYISPTIPSVGKVIGTPTGRNLAGKNDYIYLSVAGDATPGRKFYTFRSQDIKVKHPQTGTDLGYLIEITGIAEIVGEESGHAKAVVRESFLDIVAHNQYGNYLQDYFEVVPPFKTASPRTPDIQGAIVITRDRRVINAEGDIVYLDKGNEEGMLPGDVFNIISGEYPHIQLGKIVVILTKEHTSTAFVTESSYEIHRGDIY